MAEIYHLKVKAQSIPVFIHIIQILTKRKNMKWIELLISFALYFLILHLSHYLETRKARACPQDGVRVRSFGTKSINWGTEEITQAERGRKEAL